MKEALLPWLPDYFTIALYPVGSYYVAHELQSNLLAKDMMALQALKTLERRLIEVQVAIENAQKKGWKIKRTPEAPASAKVYETAKKTGIIMRNVVLEP